MNKHCFKILMICGFILFILVHNASSTPSYSLFDLAKLANLHSQTIKIAKDDLYISKEDKNRAWSALVPTATGYGSAINYKNDDSLSSDTITIGGKLTQTFTLNGRELIALDISQQSIEEKSFSLDTVRSQYFLNVTRAFFNILSSQRYLEIADSDVQRLTTYKDSVKERLNVGNVTKTDLYRAEAELSKSLTEQVISQNNIYKSKAQLKNLVDIAPSFELSKEGAKSLENYSCTVEEIKTAALEQRPEIKEARKQVEIASKTIKINKSDYWPTLSLEAGYRERDFEYQGSPNTVEYDTEDLYAQAEISIALFDGGLRKAQVRQAKAAHRQAKNRLALIEKEIERDSQIAYRDYMTAKSTLINLEDELKSAQENFNAVQMQFKYGMADSIDVMDANTLLVSAQRRISDALYTYYFSVLNIFYTKGELTAFLLKTP